MTDQQDFVRGAVIAAAGPSLVLPEQCGNWAYPSMAMSEEETAYSLAGGIVGRLYLSGFLGELRPEQRALVHAATGLHREWRDAIAQSVPSWPLGLPGWEDDVFALALSTGSACLLAVWSRGDGGPVRVPGFAGWSAQQAFPPTADAVAAVDGDLEVTFPAGPAARILRLRRPVTS
jgi:alpha-galactosidase